MLATRTHTTVEPKVATQPATADAPVDPELAKQPAAWRFPLGDADDDALPSENEAPVCEVLLPEWQPSSSWVVTCQYFASFI